MAKILITGGSGLTGKAISELLLKEGNSINWLSRNPALHKNISEFKWDVRNKVIDLRAFDGVDSIVHLAGSGIVDKRWTKSYKRQIIDSRVRSSELLYETISKNTYKIKTLVGASAIGYCGSIPTEHTFTEEDPPGQDFLAETCLAWEKSYSAFAKEGIRSVILRLGIVLSNTGGAYAKMATPFKLGLGAAIGNGIQHFSWIHIKDVAGMFCYALLNTDIKGVFNVVTSQPSTNNEFSKLLTKSIDKPFFLPNIPEIVLRLALGERAVTVTGGLKISNQKLKETGFNFKFDTLSEALKDLSSASEKI